MPTKISKICRFYAFNFYVHRFLSLMWQCVEIEQLNDYKQSGHTKIYGYSYIIIHSKPQQNILSLRLITYIHTSKLNNYCY